MAFESLINFLNTIPQWAVLLIVIWESVWTAIALWMSARRRHILWFIVFFVIQLIGIPEMIYIYVIKSREAKLKATLKKKKK